MRRLAIITVSATLLALGACSGAKVKVATTQDSPYYKYELAMDELLGGDYTKAATLFEELAAGTLNPVLSQLGTLRLGDALFFQGRYAEAAEVYREFLDQYSRSPDWPHAAYMRGLCFLRKMPEDHWVLPPAESREMSDVDNAYQSFVQLIEAAPDAYYSMRARLLLTQTVERRCRHHLYVAEWYDDRDQPKGMVQRLEQAMAEEAAEKSKGRIPATFHCADTRTNLLLLARGYDETENGEGIRRTLERYRTRAGEFDDGGSGLKKLEKLAEKYPASAAP